MIFDWKQICEWRASGCRHIFCLKWRLTAFSYINLKNGSKKPFQERIKSYNSFPFLESKSRVNDKAIANIYGSKINVMVTIIHFQFKNKCNGNGSKVNVMFMTIHYQFKRNCNGNGSFWILFVFEQRLLTLGSLAPVHHVSKVSKFLQNHERWFQHLLPSGHFS